MKYLAILLVIGVAIFAYACTPKTATKTVETKPAKAQTQTAPLEPVVEQAAIEEPPVNVKPAFVSASLKKTACFGKCPEFTVEFNASGTATYTGKRHVKKIGNYTAVLSSKDANLILQKAQDSGFFDMSKTYPTNEKHMIMDFPMTITNVKFGRQNKTVTNNSDAPQDLVNFENFLLELSETLKWVEVADE